MITVETLENGREIDFETIRATKDEGAAFMEYLRGKSESIPAGILARIFLGNYRKGLRWNSEKGNWS